MLENRSSVKLYIYINKFEDEKTIQSRTREIYFLANVVEKIFHGAPIFAMKALTSQIVGNLRKICRFIFYYSLSHTLLYN